MVKMDEIVNEKTETFICKVKNSCYYIGATVFRKCTGEEAENYKAFQKELANVRNEIKESKYKKDVGVKHAIDKLEEKYDKLKLKDSGFYYDFDYHEARRLFEAFWKTLSEEDKNDIIKQKKDLYEAEDYIDGAVYRHAPINK
jgi:hypothetical protein